VLEEDVDVTITDIEVEDGPSKPASDAKSTHIEEEIDIDETVVLEEKTPRPWRTFLTGLPDPASGLYSFLTLLINTILVLFALDFIYRGKFLYPSDDLSFARIGYVSPTEANLLIREPDSSQLPISVSYKLAMPAMAYEDPKPQYAGAITSLGPDTDYTAALKFPIPNYSDRVYQWTTSNNHTGMCNVLMFLEFCLWWVMTRVTKS